VTLAVRIVSTTLLGATVLVTVNEPGALAGFGFVVPVADADGYVAGRELRMTLSPMDGPDAA